ncbi:RHS repeat-associated core domain-containing protein [Pseudomonas putida]|uniref:RHS repeat-associated core domain-containing protein n=1 Tax=Pseudomonas putida TaxID=303 RepID=UPI003570BBE0
MSTAIARVRLFFQENILCTSIDTDTSQRIFTSNNRRLAIHFTKEGVSLLATDTQGSSIIEQHKALLHSNLYSPYGNSPTADGASTLVKFNGERSDPYSGLYLLGQGKRCFSVALMRFLSPDPLSPFGAGGPNSYGYCSGDPVNFSDPSGMLSVSQYIARKIGPATRANPVTRRTMHHTAQTQRPANVIDIPTREKRLQEKLITASIEELKKLKPEKNQVGASAHGLIVSKENYGSDTYNALYQESKAFRMYGEEMDARDMFDTMTSTDWRLAGYDIANFKIIEANILRNIIRNNKEKRWTRPSVQRAFDR